MEVENDIEKRTQNCKKKMACIYAFRSIAMATCVI